MATRCSCGLFAQWLGERHWFDGNFSRVTMTVKCAVCGFVEVELV